MRMHERLLFACALLSLSTLLGVGCGGSLSSDPGAGPNGTGPDGGLTDAAPPTNDAAIPPSITSCSPSSFDCTLAVAGCCNVM